jgi:hypothetical protein
VGVGDSVGMVGRDKQTPKASGRVVLTKPSRRHSRFLALALTLTLALALTLALTLALALALTLAPTLALPLALGHYRRQEG